MPSTAAPRSVLTLENEALRRQLSISEEEAARWRELFDVAAQARLIAESWRAQYERELEVRTAHAATIRRLQGALDKAQLAEQLALREAEQAAAQVRAARADAAAAKRRCEALSSAKVTIERDDLRRERDALLASAAEARAAEAAKRRQRPLSAAEARQIHRKRVELAAAADASLDALAGRSSGKCEQQPADEEPEIKLDELLHERLEMSVRAAESRAKSAEAEARGLRERLEAATEAADASERQSNAWRQKYLSEVQANREAAFVADRSEEQKLARAHLEAEQSFAVRSLEAEASAWKELAIAREEGLRAVHRKLRTLQLGGAPNVAHDMALRELRRDIERSLAVSDDGGAEKPR